MDVNQNHSPFVQRDKKVSLDDAVNCKKNKKKIATTRSEDCTSDLEVVSSHYNRTRIAIIMPEKADRSI